MDAHSQYFYGPPKPNNFHMMSLGILIVVPFTMFAAISCLITFLFQSMSCIAWSAIVCCEGIALLFMAVRQTRDGPNYWFNLGGLCFLSTAAAASLSLWNYSRNMYKYWAYKGQRTYTNVSPTAPALSHLDAGKIQFSENVLLDFKRTFGYSSAGHTFCVVPVVAGTPSPAEQVQYWAAGLDCCPDNRFACDDAMNTRVQGGLVYLEDELFPNNHVNDFRKATSEAQAALNIAGSKDALFLRWLRDADKVQESFRADAITYLICSLLLYLAFSIVSGFFLHFNRRTPSKGKDASYQ